MATTEREKKIADYKARLEKMSDAELLKEGEMKIWLSAYANNNPRSDYHWQTDAIYAECQRRKKPEIYSKAFAEAKSSVSG